jgi:menaquinone-dependent protoporphyrinogen oxidase
MSHILVTYASKYGATAEIAQRIAEVIQNAGFMVDCLPVSRVSDLASYDAVILGSAVYAGNWLRDAARFLERFEAPLSKRKLWLFSSGPTGKDDAVETLRGWRFPEAQRALIERLQPRDVALFHGKIDINKLHLGEKLIIRALKAETGDFRRWDYIDIWSKEIVKVLVRDCEQRPLEAVSN